MSSASKITSEVVDSLNALCEHKSFELVGTMYDWSYNIKVIELRLVYLPKHVNLLKIVHSTTGDVDEHIQQFIEEFNSELLRQILFSSPTDGEVVDEDGRKVYTFADIKPKLALKKR